MPHPHFVFLVPFPGKGWSYNVTFGTGSGPLSSSYTQTQKRMYTARQRSDFIAERNAKWQAAKVINCGKCLF